MLKEINERVEKLKNDIALKKILKGEISRLRSKLNSDEKALYNLEKQLKKEKKDVDNLNKLSVVSIISKLLNNKEEKLEKEQEEYLMAKLKYEEMLSSINILKEDLDSEEGRLDSLGNCEKEYDKLIKEKIDLLKKYGDDDIKGKLAKIDERMNNIINENKEIEEAYLAGSRLLEEVDYAEEDLRGAKNWGIFDIAGGDFLSSIAKHNKINKANDRFEKISHLINKFNKELGDVNLNNVTFSTTTMAFDLFFDNIFTDISVQNKINEAIDNVQELGITAQNIMTNLKNKSEQLEKEYETLKKEYNSLVESL